MTSTWLHVALRELREWRNVFLAAALLGLLPLVLPLLAPNHSPEEVRSVTVCVLVVLFTLCVAPVMADASTGRELAERRFGFFLSRPVSTVALWLGKLVGGLVILAGSAYIISLPAGIAGVADGWRSLGKLVWLPWWFKGGHVDPPDWAFHLSLVISLLVFLAFAQVVSIAFRSKTPWVVVDLACALGAAILFGKATRLLTLDAAYDAFKWGSFGVLTLVTIGIIVAGAAAFIRGRGDIRRAHGTLSLVLWSVVIGACLAHTGYARWVVSVPLEGLTNVFMVRPAPRGGWLGFSGQARLRGDYTAEFLYDVESGRSFRVRAYWQTVYSSDGTRAAWLEYAPSLADQERADLVTLQLDDPQAEPLRTKLVFGIRTKLLLSADGSRLATLEDGVVSLYALDEERLVASTRVAGDGSSGAILLQRQLAFADRERLRVYSLLAEAGTWGLEIAELDAGSGSVTTAILPGLIAGVTVSSKGDRILVERESDGAMVVSLHDGLTGEIIAELDRPEAEESHVTMVFAAEGRMVVSRVGRPGWIMKVFDSSGSLQREIALPAARGLALGAEVSSGHMPVSLCMGGESSVLRIVDLTTGGVVAEHPNLVPVAWARPWWNSSQTVATGSLATRLFLTPPPRRRLVLLDIETGAQRTLIPIQD